MASDSLEEVKRSFRRLEGFRDGYLCLCCKYIEYNSDTPRFPLFERHLTNQEHILAARSHVPPENKLPKNIQKIDVQNKLIFINGVQNVYCKCCKLVLDGEMESVRSHVKSFNHRKKLKGDHRTKMEISLDNEVAKHPMLSLSEDYGTFTCHACNTTDTIRYVGSIKDHVKKQNHESFCQHGESLQTRAMKEKAEAIDTTGCIQVVENKYYCNLCELFLTKNEVRGMESHLRSLSHRDKVVDEYGETRHMFNQNYCEALLAGIFRCRKNNKLILFHVKCFYYKFFLFFLFW